jgi:hypothetical protein
LKISNTKVIPLKTFIFNYYLWIFFFLVFSLINPVESATCNNFPKIFGGSSGETFLYQIDVYNDYFAMAGSTNDKSIAGKAGYMPYLALSSISTGGKYYWAKALSLKGFYFFGV